MPTSVRIDISLFTEDDAFGMISGEIEVPIMPQIGDVIVFDGQGADVVRHEAAFGMGPLEVTNRLISAASNGAVTVMLSDIEVKTKEDARQVMAFFEDCYGLFGEPWDDKELKAKSED
jgi:hypothetical protein